MAGYGMVDVEAALCAVVVCATPSKAFCKGLGDLAGICARSATAVSACINGTGNVRPRLSARRRIPAQAAWLKKYLRGRSPVSNISDKHDSPAALWNSEVLSVQHSVGPPVPELPQPPEEGAKIPSSV